MDPAQIETLVRRLVANPHDEAALTEAHQAGTRDPQAYAGLLERVGTATTDPMFAAHWFSEAANVWVSLLTLLSWLVAETISRLWRRGRRKS